MKTALNKLIDILTESKHEDKHPEFNYALDLAIAEARGLMDEEKEQHKDAWLDLENVNFEDYFNSKYNNNV